MTTAARNEGPPAGRRPAAPATPAPASVPAPPLPAGPAAPAGTVPPPAGTPLPPAGAGRRARIDWGRLLMVPGSVLVLLIDSAALTRRPGAGATGILRVAGIALTVLFYLVIIWCYLRRKRAVATSASVTAHIAAVVGTMAPFAFPLLPAARLAAGRQLAADLLLIAGVAWSVWALGSLGRSVSVLAQARELVERGPYRWVRHPLYAGELLSSLGLAVTVGTAAAAAVWLALCGLQVYRAVREEQLLLRALPGYPAYRSRTAALLPGVF